MIEAKQINLRSLEMTDLERMHRWINDREITRFLSVRYQMSLAAEEAWLRGRTAALMAYGDVSFAIETKDGRHIGSCGLHQATPENRAASLGIMIGEKDCWSHGYGTDAVRTLARFGFDDMNLHRIELHVYDFNERAIAAYRRCGFVEEGRMRDAHYGGGRYIDVIVMSVLRDEFPG